MLVLGSLAAVSVGVAQEEAPGPVVRLTTIEINPAHVQKWRGGLRALAEGARNAELPPAEFGWWAVHDGHRTTIVSLRQRDAVIAGRPMMQRIRESNAEAAAKVQEAFSGTESRVIRDEIWTEVTDLSYDAPGEIEFGGSVSVDMWVAPGKGQEFQEAVKALNKLRADAGYPYDVNVYRVMVGEPRFVAVTFFDTREAFYGANGLGRLAQAKNVEGIGQAFGTMLGTLSRYENRPAMRYGEAASYPPAP